MERNLDEIAKSLFDQIRSQIPKIKMEDAQGNATIKPEQARFFEFNYVVNGAVFGLVNIDVSSEDGVVVIYPNDITQGQKNFNKKKWFNFLKEIRECARQHLLDFNVRDISKQSLDKRDKEYMSSQKETNMSESKLFGTSKTSYQDLGNSTIIVRHSAPVNYNHPAGRTQRIESIYIENVQGERFKYPLRHLNGARALAQHIGEGGTPYDSIGRYVIGLSEELSKLRFFKNYVDRSPTISESMSTVHTKVIERIDQIKKEIHHLQNNSYYQTFSESFTENNDSDVPEEIMNDWIDRLTIKTFNEELKTVFPYIYKLVDESEIPVKELDISEIIDNDDELEYEGIDHSEAPELESYISYINSIQTEEEEKDTQEAPPEIPAGITPDAAQIIVDQLNQGVGITDILKGESSGIPEEALEGLRSMVADMAIDMELLDEKEVNDISEKVADILYQSAQEPAPAPEPAAAPAPDPAAAVPPSLPMTPGVAMAENLKRLIEKARLAGATPSTIINFGGTDLSLGEAITKAGFQIESFFDQDDQHNNESELIEFIKSMFDAETGKFPKGETGVLIACEKKFGEGAVSKAKNVVNELESRADLRRIRELSGLSNQEEGFGDELAYKAGNVVGKVQKGVKDTVGNIRQGVSDLASNFKSGQQAGQGVSGQSGQPDNSRLGQTPPGQDSSKMTQPPGPGDITGPRDMKPKMGQGGLPQPKPQSGNFAQSVQPKMGQGAQTQKEDLLDKLRKMAGIN